MSKWKWCAEDENGKIIKGWYKDNDTWYFLNDEGIMKTGWIKDNDKWYYLNEPNGDLKTGWLQLNDNQYYLEPNSTGYMGSCYTSCTVNIEGTEYTFDDKGCMVTDSLVSDELINFVKSFEGFEDGKKYYDCVGVLTQGYGLTGDEILNLPEQITEEVAATLLKNWINNKYATTIKSDLDNRGVALKQNEFDALVSFAYNCGTDALLRQSTLYKNVINGIRDLKTITSNFQSWSKGTIDGLITTIPGLYKRRSKEANIFLDSDYTGNI